MLFQHIYTFFHLMIIDEPYLPELGSYLHVSSRVVGKELRNKKNLALYIVV